MRKLMILLLSVIVPLIMAAQVQLTETNCLNGVDDDGDGLIDCFDPDCTGSPDCASLNIDPALNGVTEGTGAFFEIANSDYLSITLASSADVSVFLSSIPQIISMNISRPATEPAPYEATLTITGLLPLTLYFKYDDSYHNLDSIITDVNGNYTWTQDLTETHHVWIQPTRSTIFICDDATGCGCPIVGTWNNVTKTCTLNTDVTETIQIDSPGITLDGNNHSITGSGTGFGIYIYEKNNITIKNCIITNFSSGIYISSSSNNSFTGNTFTSNYYGLSGYMSSFNNITGNTVSLNTSYGIHFNQSSNNILINNVSNSNSYGIYLQAGVGGNTLTSNTTNSNSIGINLFSNSDNSITNNIATGNSYSGFILSASTNNTINNNNSSGNNGFGMAISSGSNNTFTDNISSNNLQSGIQLSGGSNNSISGNTTSNNNTYGIRLDYVTNSNIFNNATSFNNMGFCLNFNTGNTFLGNIINNNAGYGMFLQTGLNCIVGGTDPQQLNTITNNGISGIYLIASNGIKISGNSVYNNPIAIKNIDGSNNSKAAPVIASFDGTTVTGTSEPNDIIDVFGSTGNENANEYLTTVYANEFGIWSAELIETVQGVITTATNLLNTSVLSNFQANSISVQEFDPNTIIVRIKDDFSNYFSEWTKNNNEQYISDNSTLDSAFNNALVSKIEKTFKILSKKSIELKNIYTISVDSSIMVDSLISFLVNQNEILYAEKVSITYLSFDPNDPLKTNQWFFDNINLKEAWDIEQGDPNIKIAIIDDAVRFDHLDLSGNLWLNTLENPSNSLDDDQNGYINDYNGWDAADWDNDPNPNFATITSTNFIHGTHVTGIAAAKTNNNTGVASVGFNCSFIPVKCRKNNNTDGGMYDIDLIHGIEYAIVIGANVINMSWGKTTYNSAIQDVLNVASNSGIILVAASGNDGTNVNASVPHYPASYNNVISVASSNELDKKSNFSCYGSTIDVVAPGSQIYSTIATSNNSYDFFSGTSMAAPIVSGLCGLMKSYCLTCTSSQIENCIINTCTPMPSEALYNSGDLGSGLVNAEDALLCLRNTPVIAEFEPEYEFICPGSSINFLDRSTGWITSWSWTATNGASINNSHMQNPIITFNSAGTYTINLVVVNSVTGSISAISHTYIVVQPSATFINPSSGNISCNGNPYQLMIEFSYANPPYSFSINGQSYSGLLDNPCVVDVYPPANLPTTYCLSNFASGLGCVGSVISPITQVTSQNCDCTTRHNNNWHFGADVGITFFPSTIKFDGIENYYERLWALETSSTISDANGNFLFSCDGRKIIDKTRTRMFGNIPATSFLQGSHSATQTSVILPQSIVNNLYYVFTVGGASGSAVPTPITGIWRHIVDMSLPGTGSTTSPNGEIIERDIALETFGHLPTEKLTWTNHGAIAGSYWLLTYSLVDNSILVYLINSTGVSNPQIFDFPITPSLLSNFGRGMIKVNSAGNRIALASMSYLDIYDFDNTTGSITLINRTSAPSANIRFYGVEFSPNSNYLYITGSLSAPVYRLDLTNFSLSTFGSAANYVGIQRHPYLNQILISNCTTNSISIISNPDAITPIISTSLTLNSFSPTISVKSGIPQLVPDNSLSAYVSEIVDDCNNNCSGSATVDVTDGFPPFTFLWSDNSHQTSQSATGLCPGNYDVIVSDSHGCQNSISININTNSVIIGEINSENACNGQNNGSINVSLQSGFPPYTYTWTGPSSYISHNEDIIGLSPGVYSVTVTDSHSCSTTASITISSSIPISLSISSIAESCINSTNGSAIVTVNPNTSAPYNFLWSNGYSEVNNSTSINGNISSGNYTVTITDYFGCSATTSVFVDNLNIIPATADFNINPDGCLWINESFFFNVSAPQANASYEWEFSDGVVLAGANVEREFSNYGYYCVNLTANNVCGIETSQQTIFIMPGKCYCDNNWNYENISINNDLNIDYQTLYINGDMIISGGSYVYILGSTLFFSPKGRLIVERGSRLFLTNSTLDVAQFSNCENAMWQGVEVWGQQMMPSVNPGMIILNNSSINNAHIAVLLGNRNMNYICNSDLQSPYPPGSYNSIESPISMARSGGKIIVRLRSNFNNNGINILLTRTKSYSQSYGNDIKLLNFTSGILNDPLYNINQSNHYPNIYNPYTGQANFLQRTDASIIIDNILFKEDKPIFDCSFKNNEYGILSFNSKYNVKNCTYDLAFMGIRISNSVSGIDYSHKISLNTFTRIPNNLDKGFCIYIEGGAKDYIYQNTFGDFSLSNQSLFDCGIYLDNTNNFFITTNYFYFLRRGLQVRNSGLSLASNIGAVSTSWMPNVFNYCKVGIITDQTNKFLKIKCNEHRNPNINYYSTNWYNNGILAQQGQPIPNSHWISVDPANAIKCPAGNEFFPETNNARKRINTINNTYRYYRHDNPPSTIPTSDPLSILPVGIYPSADGIQYPTLTKGSNPASCGMPIFGIIINPIIHAPLTDYPFTVLDSVAQAIELMNDEYNILINNIDKGNTMILLNAIYSNMSQGNLKNILVSNSPLSDSVLVSLITRNRLSSGNMKLVLERNLPVSENVEPYFYALLKSLPNGIARQLEALNGANPQYTTPWAIKNQINYTEGDRRLLLSQFIEILTDTLNNRREDALTLISRETDADYRRVLIASLLSGDDISLAHNSLTNFDDESNQELIDWKWLMQIEMNNNADSLNVYNETIINEIRRIASKCPKELSSANAASILFRLYRESVPECDLLVTNRNLIISNPISTRDNDAWLDDNYPEPYENYTTLHYYCPEGETGKFEIIDIFGRCILSFNAENGEHEIVLKTENWLKGLYLCKYSINNTTIETIKLIKNDN